MIILNTTFVVHHSIVNDILAWVRGVYCRSAYRHGAMAETTLLTKVLTEDRSAADQALTDETYALHLSFPDMPTAVRWNDEHASKLFDLIQAKHGLNILKFHTYLLVI